MAKRNMNLHINMSLIMCGVDTMYWYMNTSGLYCRTQKLKQGKQFYKKIAAEIIGL